MKLKLKNKPVNDERIFELRDNDGQMDLFIDGELVIWFKPVGRMVYDKKAIEKYGFIVKEYK